MLVQKKDANWLVEWAVWGHLDSKNDLELILLKGHLILEGMLDLTLERNGISGHANFSFYRKVVTLETLAVRDQAKRQIVVYSLKEINKLRNKVAHEIHFKLENGTFEKWTVYVLENLRGEKFSKYTFRTKIVHSFSVLSRNVLELGS